VPDPAGVVAKHAKGYEKRKRHASVTVGAVEAPRKDASVDGELEPTPSTRNIKGWRAGTRWFRNRPGSITRDGTVGTDRCALDAGFVSVSLLETAGGGTRLGGARARLPATAFAEAGDVAAFFAKASEELR
jgi:hypothetical protein